MAITGIDHLVIAVRDPDGAADALGRGLGLAFTGGGRHEDAGTWNRLAFLGDTYLELIGVFDRGLVLANAAFAVGRAALAVLDAGREGLATWALATDDCLAEASRLRASGSPIGTPIEGSRRRPDGEVVRWLTAFPTLGPEEPPFLIEHEPVGAEWGAAARAARAAFRHPAGGTLRVARVELPVADPAAAAARWRTVLGIEFGLDGRATVGNQVVEVCAPGPGTQPVVRIVAIDGDVAPLDAVRLGVRWRIIGR